MKLFEDKIRTRKSYAKHSELAYDYYDSSALTDMTDIREYLNSWFDLFPEIEKKELKTRFKKEFDSAFYELFLFTLFSRIGYEVEVHPVITGSKKRPDFLIKDGSFEFYLEAKIDKDMSNKDEAQEKSLSHLYDSLSNIQTEKFLLEIKEIEIKSSQQPESKNLIKSIETWLENIDFSYVHSLCEKGEFDKLPKFVVDNEKLLLELLPIPMNEEFHGKSEESPLGMYPAKSFIGGPVESLRKAIQRKVKRYGKLDKPYLIAINELSKIGVTENEIYYAIFGILNLSSDYNQPDKPIRAQDGIVIGNNGFRNRNINGFLITKANPHNLHVADYWLIKHPDACLELDFDKLPFSYKYVKNKKIESKNGKSIKQLIL